MNDLENIKIDLAILDIMMPGVDGFSLCEEIRKKYNFPIIFVTAKVENIDKISGFAIGADDYVTKPFEPLELVARVKAQIRRYKNYNKVEENEEVIDFRNIVINNNSHEFYFKDKKILLTPIEFSIMWYLCKNRGTTVKTEDLFMEVWKEKYYEICKSKTLMINENSGHDIIYQKNKVENLKIANQTMNHILIYPNETFSFYYLVRNSRKYGSYKDGLILVDGKIVAKKGGGICHLSNLLYYLFLMSPLTVVERHGHKIKSFPNPDKSSLEGIDATISSGWLDLKVKNETNNIYQIDISFDENYMYGKILSDKESTIDYKIVNGNLNYIKENNKIYECVEVIRIEIDKKTKKEIKKEKLYDEKVLIKYELPSDVKVEEM